MGLLDLEPSPAFLRRMLMQMGQTGQPPERGAALVNVGTEPILEALRVEYLTPIKEYGINSAFKLVQATFGGGKTHFLHCLREVAWREGLATSLVGLSPQHCPFDDLAQVYRRLAEELEAPPENLEVEADRGIDAVLRSEVERRAAAYGESTVKDWLKTEAERLRVDSRSYRTACVRYMEAVLGGDHETESMLAAFLRGENVTLKETRCAGVREVLEAKTAFRFILSLAQVLRGMGLPGLVMMFDEMDRQMSLTARRRRAVADNLRETIDYAGQARLPGTLFVYAVPPEFLTNIVPEYPALEQRLRHAARFSEINPLAPVIDLEKLDGGLDDFLRRIGEKLLELHLASGGGRLDQEVQRANIDVLARKVAEGQLETGSRRTFVKAALQMLEMQARGTQGALEEAEIEALLGGGALETEEDSEVQGEEIF